MRQNLVALFCGLLFGFGLGYSKMTDRARVPGFLDFTGEWDPTLLFVMAGAVLVTLVSFRFVLRRPDPIFARRFYLPTREDINPQIVVGAGLFGVGWALSGWCPAPGITAVTLGTVDAVIFIVAMAAGSFAYRWWSGEGQAEPVPPMQPTTTGGD